MLTCFVFFLSANPIQYHYHIFNNSLQWTKVVYIWFIYTYIFVGKVFLSINFFVGDGKNFTAKSSVQFLCTEVR